MTPMKSPRSLSVQRGAMLVEGMAAILIFSLGILAIIGLQAASIKSATDAKFRVDASLLANQALADMWVDTDNLGAYAREIPVTTLPNGKRKIEINGDMITVTVTWKLPSDTKDRKYVTVTQLGVNKL